MKLPNDLIKSTDYDTAKDRIIHEFECVNGKVVQHYVLGGEHELTSQEIIDCLNALATIDCDLQTAYAYIKGQEDKIADLEAKLAKRDETIDEINKNFLSAVKDWKQLVEIEKAEKDQLKQQLEMQENTITNLIEDNRASQEWYKKQLAESEERINWLVEAEFNRKWAKKYVEMRRKEDPMLCLPDSDEVYERYFEQKEYIEKLEADLDQAFNLDDIYAEKTSKMAKEFNDVLDKANQDKISFAVEQLEKVKWWCQGNAIQCFYNEAETEIKEKHIVVDSPQENGSPSLIKYIDNQINVLRNNKDGIH